ncbi:MAG: class II aldolase/adducin family protein [Deltaproteobacteria bacterium]|nr:class II aldolase/adducin family protein [Deltaproteobacteria bacterium]
MKIRQELREEVAAATRLFWEKGLTPGRDSGDTSLRDVQTGLIYICPRPKPNVLRIPYWGMIKAEHIVVIDPDGNVVDDSGLLPTVEAPMHLAIYRARPDVNAIVHSHAIWSSTFAVTGKNVPLILAEQSLRLGGEVICAAYGKVGSEEIARNIVAALGKNKMAALMQNHGAVAIGVNFEEAFINSDFLEKGAQVALLGATMGPLIVRKPDEILDDSLL